MDYEVHTLTNGIKLIHRGNKSIVAHFGVIINTGARDENDDEHGMAHFIEHAIFKGTTKRKPFHILSRMEDVGGDINAYTSKEEICVHSTFLNAHYDRAFELISDILFNSTFPEKELEKEKEVILDEINSYKDSPSELIYDEFEELIYQDQTIGHNILGTEDSLKKITQKEILKFIENNFHTDQMVISSVGSIGFLKLIKIAEKYFGNIPTRHRKHERTKNNIYIPNNKIINKDTFQTHCMIGNIAYDINHKQAIDLFLLNNILGGPALNSRLNMVIREKYGFAYNIESLYSAYTDTGIFQIYVGADKQNLDKSIELIFKELDKLKNKKLGTSQLKKAKQQMVGQLAIARENQEALMLAMGKRYLHLNKFDNMETMADKINTITDIDLMDVANEVFDTNKLSMLIYK